MLPRPVLHEYYSVAPVIALGSISPESMAPETIAPETTHSKIVDYKDITLKTVKVGSRLMLRLLRQSTFIIALLIGHSLKAQSLNLKSTAEPVQFLELYTSQGCSSCPPAEKWINQFSDEPHLWKTLFPLNMHVDYWDYLGWKDPFADNQFSQRQRRYHTLARTQNVATPGFVVNGHGWNGWFRRQPMKRQSRLSNAELKVKLQDQDLEIAIRYGDDSSLQAHIAILGFGIETKVKRGENRGKTLHHDFVVIGYKQLPLNAASATTDLIKTDKKTPERIHPQISTSVTSLPAIRAVETSRKALVVWVSTQLQPAPIQVVGSWLDEIIVE